VKIIKVVPIPLVVIFLVSLGCSSPKKEKKAQSKPMQFMERLLDGYRDEVNGGIYHALSEDWSTITDSSKYCEDQFLLARTFVFQNMMTGNPASRDKARELTDFAIEKFEDRVNGGFYKKFTKDWKIADKEKNLHVLSNAFGTIMHLYEITFDDYYLLKCFDLLDLVLDKCWDKTHGGFFESYSENWTPKGDTKNLVHRWKSFCTSRGLGKMALIHPMQRGQNTTSKNRLKLQISL